MKSLRYILIGLIVGGAFGSKFGIYLSNLFGGSSFDAMELGFIYGAAFGSISVAVYIMISSIATQEKDATQLFSSKELTRSSSL